jgi:hypothetical protein
MGNIMNDINELIAAKKETLWTRVLAAPKAVAASEGIWQAMRARLILVPFLS